MNARLIPAVALATATLTSLLPLNAAYACGCFAPPDPTVPVVQAGERIVFAHQDGNVVAHIQIQYQGEASEFGWLLPLPSIPTLRLGTEELFNQLIATTQPRYRLNRIGNDQCLFNVNPGFRGGPPNAAADASSESGRNEPSPVVIEDSIGPYDLAVLKADNRDEMFAWLNENRYFIPTGTEDVVGPYIRPGAYFLALKLRKGNDAGDIQPVVLEYPSDLPMIPLILTSVAATPEMGVQVWVLGDGRAIPRNYRHTVLNEQHIDWFGAGVNYPEVITTATNEATDGQAFVTEYAGSTDRMKGLLAWSGRFGVRAELETETDPFLLAERIQAGAFPNTSSVRNILARYYPYPSALEAQGVDEDSFYQFLGFYMSERFRSRNPGIFENYDLSELDGPALVADLWERIVVPTEEAEALFEQNPYMTRMLTTLSPEEMTRDPVFSFNASLPDVSNEHSADFKYICDENQDGLNNTPGILTLGDGRSYYVPVQSLWANEPVSEAPFSLRIEMLREEGQPVIELDNGPLLRELSGNNEGCTCAQPRQRVPSWAALGLLGLAVVLRRRRS